MQIEQLMTSSNKKWQSVLAREISADGEFVYAVKSTGIFCRPSCPSRRPNREQVEFFNSAADAQKAGYRSCMRCTPSERNPQLGKIETACRYIEQNLETTLSLKSISAKIGMSPFYFQRLFKRTLGISPREYQKSKRASQFRAALRTQSRVTDAIYEAGYSSSSRAYEQSAREFGMTPSDFRRKGEGIAINFTVISTELGKMLVAATPRGICSVRFGESEVALAKELKQEFEAAKISRDDDALGPVATRVMELLDATSVPSGFALDIQGTAFQQLVWNALRQIPRGQTCSYAEVAASIGKPKAVRAVASACASNPLAIVVPCHRVVHKNGSLSGYRWGVERKAALLRRERARNSRATSV